MLCLCHSSERDSRQILVSSLRLWVPAPCFTSTAQVLACSSKRWSYSHPGNGRSLLYSGILSGDLAPALLRAPGVCSSGLYLVHGEGRVLQGPSPILPEPHHSPSIAWHLTHCLLCLRLFNQSNPSLFKRQHCALSSRRADLPALHPCLPRSQFPSARCPGSQCTHIFSPLAHVLT